MRNRGTIKGFVLALICIVVFAILYNYNSNKKREQQKQRDQQKLIAKQQQERQKQQEQERRKQEELAEQKEEEDRKWRNSPEYIFKNDIVRSFDRFESRFSDNIMNSDEFTIIHSRSLSKTSNLLKPLIGTVWFLNESAYFELRVRFIPGKYRWEINSMHFRILNFGGWEALTDIGGSFYIAIIKAYDTTENP